MNSEVMNSKVLILIDQHIFIFQSRDKAEGYEEGATIIHKKIPVSQFIHAENFMEVLADAWEVFIGSLCI